MHVEENSKVFDSVSKDTLRVVRCYTACSYTVHDCNTNVDWSYMQLYVVTLQK